ncbi:hypothetical protein M432DRAFT_588960 [Thermoascus aurantiacus ATCC 26904]
MPQSLYDMNMMRTSSDIKIDLNRYDQVWIDGEPYPGELPEEIKEYLGDQGGDGDGDEPAPRSIQWVGPIRTIFWLSGYDDLVRAVDDPAYRLEDEVVAVPHGCHPGAFLVPWTGFTIPSQVAENAVSEQRIADLYPLSRPQWCLPETVKCVRLKNARKAFNEDGDTGAGGLLDLDSPNVCFRGLSLAALEMSMSFFISMVDPVSMDQEFGPGIYTTTNFATAKQYAGPNGAIMVFDIEPNKYSDSGLNVWRPSRDEWNRLTAVWLRIPNLAESGWYKY